MRRRRQVYEITVIYKSGATAVFEAYEFSYRNGVYSWEVPTVGSFQPLLLGADEVAAVWQKAA